MIHVTSLADDYYYLEAGTHTLVGRASGRRYRLGDRLEVTIARVDVDRRELALVPADRPDAEVPLPTLRPPRPVSADPGRGKPERQNQSKGKPKGKAQGKAKRKRR
jgi:ribonuclease R